MTICFFGVSLAGVTADGSGRGGVIIVLLMNFTVGYALKYAAKPPVFITNKKDRTKNFNEILMNLCKYSHRFVHMAKFNKN